MFDIAATELLVVVIVAILVIGPKDMPTALRAAGRWIGKARRMSAHFRSGIDAMIRDAEVEEMNRKWSEQNAAVMAAHPNDEMRPISPGPQSGPEAIAAAADDASPADQRDGTTARETPPPPA